MFNDVTTLEPQKSRHIPLLWPDVACPMMNNEQEGVNKSRRGCIIDARGNTEFLKLRVNLK